MISTRIGHHLTRFFAARHAGKSNPRQQKGPDMFRAYPTFRYLKMVRLLPSGGKRRGRGRRFLLVAGLLCALLSLFLLVIFGICIAHDRYDSLIGSGDARKNRRLFIDLANHRIVNPREAIRTKITRLRRLLLLRPLNRNPLCHGLHVRFVLPLGLGRHN
jgi:hypothetical protein